MSTRRTMARFQSLVVGLAVLLLALVVWPVATPVFFAIVLAGSLFPFFVRLTARLGGRRSLSSGLLTAAMLLVVLGPLAGLITLGVTQAREFTAAVQQASQDGQLTEAIGRLPHALQGTALSLAHRIPNLAEVLQSGGTAMAATVGNLISTTGHLLLMVALTFIGLYIFLLEGPALIAWLDALVPMREGEFRSILGEFRTVSRSVLLAVGATAAAQAFTGLIGLLIAGVPNPIFFALLAFFLALVPAVGAASCFVVMGLAYLLGGATGTGIFLLLWGVLAVGLVDNLLRPYFIGDGTAMHSGLVFFSLLGGIAMFGVAGLVAGPLTVAFFIAVMRVETRQRRTVITG